MTVSICGNLKSWRRGSGPVLDTACNLSDQDLFMGFYGLCIIKAHTAVHYPFSHHVTKCIYIDCPRWLRIRSAQVSAYTMDSTCPL